MNILHVESSSNWGGQEYRTVAETRWLNTHGHHALIACNPDSEIRRQGGDLCLNVQMRASFSPWATIQIRNLCRRHAIGVIHVHSPKDAWICYPLYLAGMPLVRSRQITSAVKRTWSRSFIYRQGCSQVIATAHCIRHDLIMHNGVCPERIAVVGEGVNLSEFNPQADAQALRRELGVSRDAPLFGIVAMIRPEKGHVLFVEAARQVLQDHPKARFIIVGEGTGSRQTEIQVRTLIRSRFGSERAGPVIMTGYRSDVATVMSALDVVVVPSIAEAQSLVVPQAFATRRAVIASNVGGLPELVRHHETGLLTKPGCSVSLANAMRLLANDRDLRERIARNGYWFAKNFLSFDRKMEEMLSIYHEISSRRDATTSARSSRSEFRRTIPFELGNAQPPALAHNRM